MSRVAIVALQSRLREALVELADSGLVQLAGTLPAAAGEEVEALRRLERKGAHTDTRRLAAERPDVESLVHNRRPDLLAGEIELKRRAASAIRRRDFAVLVGWTPTDSTEALAARLASVGAAVVELPQPRWGEPPTLLRPLRPARPFRPLVDTYGTARYASLDPTPFAAVTFVLMFGMMFGDVGHGLLLLLLALALRRSRRAGSGLRSLWPLPAAAGAAAAVFGLLYGEVFGPTGLIEPLWLEPVEEPLQLLAAAIGVGAGLLATSYALGTVNRWREGGASAALVSPSGLAGMLLLAAGALAAAAWYLGSTASWIAAAVTGAGGAALLLAGFLREAGRGAAAATEATIGVVDTGVRLLANVISFTRLAAFGLMHAAITALVFDAASALWGGAIGSLLAAVAFVVGNVLAFALGVLVAGVQALRLEYYELFSRVFAGEGNPFEPWKIPVTATLEAP